MRKTHFLMVDRLTDNGYTLFSQADGLKRKGKSQMSVTVRIDGQEEHQVPDGAIVEITKPQGVSVLYTLDFLKKPPAMVAPVVVPSPSVNNGRAAPDPVETYPHHHRKAPINPPVGPTKAPLPLDPNDMPPTLNYGLYTSEKMRTSMEKILPVMWVYLANGEWHQFVDVVTDCRERTGTFDATVDAYRWRVDRVAETLIRRNCVEMRKEKMNVPDQRAGINTTRVYIRRIDGKAAARSAKAVTPAATATTTIKVENQQARA